MKKSILIVFFIFSAFLLPQKGLNETTHGICVDLLELIDKDKHNVDLHINPHLINAMIQVESNGGKQIYGDLHLGFHRAVGVLQIRPIMVDDVNRILELQNIPISYTYDDRYDEQKSIEMFMIYIDYYADGRTDDYELIARIWNGGPDGHQQYATLSYWDKVNEKLPKKSP